MVPKSQKRITAHDEDMHVAKNPNTA